MAIHRCVGVSVGLSSVFLCVIWILRLNRVRFDDNDDDDDSNECIIRVR
ncbi:unnamed protein product [Onchocerca flexuosa]|uniref:Transmembrane protein n=1 Tax=Onchocerca flexuosa TaxID=387005 RepID=A0A183H667_9BILA|nr:unnamed protein product [Onchocerca flexuosa]